MNDLGLNQLYAEQKKLEGGRERPPAAFATDARDACTASDANAAEASNAAETARAATNEAAQAEAHEGAAAATNDGVRRRRGFLARLGFS